MFVYLKVALEKWLLDENKTKKNLETGWDKNGYKVKTRVFFIWPFPKLEIELVSAVRHKTIPPIRYSYNHVICECKERDAFFCFSLSNFFVFLCSTSNPKRRKKHVLCTLNEFRKWKLRSFIQYTLFTFFLSEKCVHLFMFSQCNSRCLQIDFLMYYSWWRKRGRVKCLLYYNYDLSLNHRTPKALNQLCELFMSHDESFFFRLRRRNELERFSFLVGRQWLLKNKLKS